jgi:hypothetical protein
MAARSLYTQQIGAPFLIAESQFGYRSVSGDVCGRTAAGQIAIAPTARVALSRTEAFRTIGDALQVRAVLDRGAAGVRSRYFEISPRRLCAIVKKDLSFTRVDPGGASAEDQVDMLRREVIGRRQLELLTRPLTGQKLFRERRSVVRKVCFVADNCHGAMTSKTLRGAHSGE